MNRFVELTASLATFIEQKQRAGFNLIVLLALIAVIVHFLSPKDQLEKNEALKQVLLFGGILFILHFMLTVVTSLGQVANSDPFYLANVFGLCIGGYWLSYTLQVKAKKDGKPVLHTKAYRQLEDIEVWLDAKGQQGFLLDSASPDYFGFNFIQTDCPYQYKTAYYPSSKMKEMAAFVEKNERDGWEFVRTGLSNGYVNPKKTIGLNTVAIFKTSDLALVKGDSFRFSYQNATGKIGRTFSINLFILIVFMVATWYFMISNYCLTQRS